MPPPRKKDRLRGSLSPMREQFPPQGRSAAVKWDCRAKAARTRAQKQPPARAGDCAQAAPMGKRWAMRCLVLGSTALGCPPGQRARPGTKTAPGEAGSCAQAAPAGERQATGVSGAEKHHTGHPPGQRAYPAQKQPPAEAGGCLDAGYECYLPRAIRVIWMHRVGSTARPRIMPS